MTTPVMLLAIVHDSQADAQSIQDSFVEASTEQQSQANKLQNLFAGLAMGAYQGKVYLALDDDGSDDRASLAFTIAAGNAVADETVTIGGVVLTWKASAASEDEVTIGGSATASATNLVAKINAHSELAGLVVASSAAGVVTVACQFPGRIGNLITVAESGTNTSWAGGATRLAGGDGTNHLATRSYSFGGV